MRTFSEKENENNIWETFLEIATFFKLSFKPNLEKDEEQNIRYYDVYHDDKYIFTIPVPKSMDLKKVLSLPAPSDDKNTDVKKNSSLRHYTCRRGDKRCKSACREALMMACIILPVCEYDFYMQMTLSCKYECEDRFY
ncbi:hypothetical protein KGM_211988 [Danaus plexippus plexippus]|uniref:Uncharacterized protein n=1 Tax=Danaus plexippus plexippus TaxID=278856 RepID=A0A212FHR8_DANPL|nr:hypothetical protein KGM_211988 [Danaus plexippus plexippus]